jgi:multiple sugar transport system substrate-binding protein
MSYRILHWVPAVACAVLAACAPRSSSPSPAASITIIWHAGSLADQLVEMSKEYTALTGVEVEAVLPPMNDAWYSAIAADLAGGGSKFDICIFDSQSMSEFAAAGHLVRLDDLLGASDAIAAADFDPTALRRYGEYPEGSGTLYALPINQDAMGLVYRRDLFEDAAERAAFRGKYGYELEPPVRYDRLRDIAEFFTRPESDLYGIALYGSADYDGVTSAFNNVLWSFGGELWDPAAQRATGALDSPESTRALEFFRELFRFAPPDAARAYVPEVNDAVIRGRAAMAIQWYYFFRKLDDDARRANVTLGFRPLPGVAEDDGSLRRAVMVGGQGAAISRYSKHRQEAWKFLEWFMGRERQWSWVERGGRTGLSSILHDSRFRAAAPGNDTFAESMGLTKDYWHTASYPTLLRIYQGYAHRAVVGEMAPQLALRECAREHDAVLAAAAAAL